MNKIKCRVGEDSTKLLIPTVFFKKFHDEGKLRVYLGIAFWKWCPGVEIEISDKHSR